MSSGSLLAGLTVRGGQKVNAAIGRRQSTMNDVHAVAIQNHYAAVIHQQEHGQHLEAVKQAHAIAGDRGFSVTTNNRSFVVGKSPGSPKGSTGPENNVENPNTGGGGSEGSLYPPKKNEDIVDAEIVEDKPLAIGARENKGAISGSKPQLAIEAKPSSLDNGNIWRMGTSGIKPATPEGQHHAANPRQFVGTPEGAIRRVDRTDSSFGENLSANEDRYLAERGANLRNDSRGGVAGRGGSNLNSPFSGTGSPATRNGVAGQKRSALDNRIADWQRNYSDKMDAWHERTNDRIDKAAGN